jgi:hypothetical protein
VGVSGRFNGYVWGFDHGNIGVLGVILIILVVLLLLGQMRSNRRNVRLVWIPADGSKA